MRNIDRFIGREKELKILKDSIKNREKGVCIYGPRRVGKTTLISVALSDLDSSVVIYYECVKGSYLYNLELLATEASRVLGLSYIRSLRDIFDIFEAIERESRGKHIVVVIDEYPYMRESCQSGVLDSYFQRIIDNMCSNITVIISGSYITVMKEILESDSPLFGRFDRVLNIKPFSYIEASLFYPSLAFRDKIAFYAVFGGYPFSLKMIDEDKWLHTGDIGYMDENGRLYIVERIKRVIIRADGFKIFSSKIENAVNLCDEVDNSVAVATPDLTEAQGELPVVYITLKKDHNLKSQEEIINELKEICRVKLAEYEQPIEFIVKSELPLTSIGKVDSFKLKQEQYEKSTLIRKRK